MQTPVANQLSHAQIAIPFIRAVGEVFRSMIGMEMATGKPFLKTEGFKAHFVSGVIGFSGGISGNVVVSFPRNVALELVKILVGTPLNEQHPDFSDAIGELTNLIVGGAKNSLGPSISISAPSVILGQGYVVAHKSGTPCLVIPCSCMAGEFRIEITFQLKAS
jgi:chemotaxis protein CheX